MIDNSPQTPPETPRTVEELQGSVHKLEATVFSLKLKLDASQEENKELMELIERYQERLNRDRTIDR